MSHRNPGVLGIWGPNGTRAIAAGSYWRQPEKWNRDAEKAGERRRVFCASLADVFEGPETMPLEVGSNARDVLNPGEWVPILNNAEVSYARERLFQLIDETPWLDWLLLTKRPQHVLPLYGTYVHWMHLDKWPRNAWIGASVERQEYVRPRCEELLKIRAAGCPVCFLSCEPLLEAVVVKDYLDRDHGINWVIVGGESGSHAREFDPFWGELLRDQCQEKNVPYFFKQMGENVLLQTLKLRHKGGDWDDIPERLRIREFPENSQ